MPGDKLTTVLKAALQYRAEGRSVLPLINKKPKVYWKDLQSRLATEEELTEWFGRNPSLQIAMVMGRVSGGLWVMDADGRAAVDWMKENAPPTTVHVNTRRGRHAYYLMPPEVEIRSGANVIPELKKSTGDQIDIKGEGGYTVVPPSAFQGGEYRWEISGAGWDGLTVWQPPSVQTASALRADGGFDLSGVQIFGDLSPVDDGQRNAKLASIVGRFINEGMSLEAILVWAAGWNRQNNPPLEPEVLSTTVESIARTHIRNHGSLPARPVQIEELPEPKKDDGCPDRILKPGGLLQNIMDYIEKSSVTSFDLFSMAAALTAVGTLVGQKVMTETGLRTNLYVFALAPSGTGKNSPIAAIRKLMFEANCSRLIGPSHLASDAALVTSLAARESVDDLAMLLLIDEIGDLIGAVKNKNNLAKSGLIHLLKELYSATDTIYVKSYADKKNEVTINYPHLSFYATGVPLRFWGNLNHDDVIDGFLPRSLVFSVDLKVKKKKKPLIAAPPAPLVDSVKALFQIEGAYTGNTRSVPVPAMVCKTPEAEDYFDRWDDHLVDLQNKYRQSEDGRGAIYNRAAEHVHKIALIHAVSLAGGLPEKVELASVKYAIDLVDWCLPQMVKHIADNVNYNEQDGLRKRILAMVDRKGSIAKRDIYINLHGCNSKMAEDAIKILEESGELVLAEVEKKNGRAAYVWVRPQPEEKQ